ncbi:hypothetical protein K0M31_001322, partial [Melipona bicolor]
FDLDEDPGSGDIDNELFHSSEDVDTNVPDVSYVMKLNSAENLQYDALTNYLFRKQRRD